MPRDLGQVMAPLSQSGTNLQESLREMQGPLRRRENVTVSKPGVGLREQFGTLKHWKQAPLGTWCHTRAGSRAFRDPTGSIAARKGQQTGAVAFGGRIYSLLPN